MGCLASKPDPTLEAKKPKNKEPGLKRPKWSSEKDIDKPTLQKMREEFWDTQPAYGGAKEVWEALKAVAEDLSNPNNPLILESAGISYQNNDIRTTYDEKGFKYDLPNFVLSDPSNLAKSAATETEAPVEVSTEPSPGFKDASPPSST